MCHPVHCQLICKLDSLSCDDTPCSQMNTAHSRQALRKTTHDKSRKFLFLLAVQPFSNFLQQTVIKRDSWTQVKCSCTNEVLPFSSEVFKYVNTLLDAPYASLRLPTPGSLQAISFSLSLNFLFTITSSTCLFLSPNFLLFLQYLYYVLRFALALYQIKCKM